ncbi:permease [Pseudooceanicola sediminis]|uniref:Permease n=1 Tax=Pseudooceanicola sediminis TaxID=2211117 RepID=A0A399JBF1_9RHOB|nr:permease [Pseudooceanicola sediminis]KAA2314164.1 permease [Puniceibacterium sp. HSS470]RII39976.1 permease [Pseudooceanicola sediminis]|tara:strand:- start:35052 stop:36113 length:1062 start_codon:yes stop_codon:yes gene_type:complete
MTEMMLIEYRRLRAKLDGAWVSVLLVLGLIAALDPAQLGDSVVFAGRAYLGTLPFIVFAVCAIGYLKASGAEVVLARAFEGREARMIVMAALLGGLSPFCSCEVIPFIAALLAVGAPLSAVMAFWLASPLMDPAMFTITAGTLGMEFAVGKAIAAIGLGLFGGAVVMALKGSVVFADPLRQRPAIGGCCGVKQPFQGKPVWRVWTDADRRATFRETAFENLLFLTKWLVLAYVLETVMLEYVPAEWIAGVLGGTGPGPIVLGALVGAPAYLNGYAAVPLVGALLDQGMAPGAAMSFIIAGGVSCIPAAVAVWALVKPRVFMAYLGLAILGAMIAGGLWGLWAPTVAQGTVLPL